MSGVSSPFTAREIVAAILLEHDAGGITLATLRDARALIADPVNNSAESLREAYERAAEVADYAVERATRDWSNPDKQDAVKQVGVEIADVIRDYARTVVEPLRPADPLAGLLAIVDRDPGRCERINQYGYGDCGLERAIRDAAAPR